MIPSDGPNPPSSARRFASPSPRASLALLFAALVATGLFACAPLRTLPLEGNPETLREAYGSLPRGERVTVYDREGRRFDGPLVRADVESLAVAVNPETEPHTFPTREMASLAWKGPRFGITGGMITGFAAGAAVGGLIGTVLYSGGCEEMEGGCEEIHLREPTRRKRMPA